jgi:dTDP-4-amino-4,6-dideoxygalactose transaminase
MNHAIPFNRPHLTGLEFEYIREAIENVHLSGNGAFTRRCCSWLESHQATGKALLTHSCTGALEMAAIMVDLQPGDEVIMPSYTFVSTANAVALRGAVPVFVDIRPDTLNIDEAQVEAAVTPRTKAIIVVHYAGVSCEMDAIIDIASRHRLVVIEDAAQGLLSTYKGRPLGSIGDLGTLSFHETKNVTCGEGGALLVNRPDLVERSEVVQEKGTNRSRFFRGQVDKYTWVELGSSFLPSEISAAFLFAQLERAEEITRMRHAIWNRYHAAFESLEARGVVRRPVVPAGCGHNAHLYYLLLKDVDERSALIESLNRQGVAAVFHYVPLHTSEAGRRLGRAYGTLPHTTKLSDRLVRLPLWADMRDEEVSRVIAGVAEAIQGSRVAALSSP